MEKEPRSNYHSFIKKFLKNLIKLSTTLKGVDHSSRNIKLKFYMTKCNNWLEKNRKNNA